MAATWTITIEPRVPPRQVASSDSADIELEEVKQIDSIDKHDKPNDIMQRSLLSIPSAVP